MFLTEAGEPRAFVIVSSARSGSNLLVAYVRQVARAACFGEILRDHFPLTPGWHRLVRRLKLPTDAGQLHHDDLSAFWELVLARSLRQRRWAGAKVFTYHRPGDPVWSRFEAEDHRVIHLVRDATFEQYVSRLLAVESGEWKGLEAAGSQPDPRVTFDVDDYLRYRTALRQGVEAVRARYGASERYVELEYRQLSDHAFVEDLLMRLFGERPDVRETLHRQRGRPKIEYLANPEAATPFADDSLRTGFADP